MVRDPQGWVGGSMLCSIDCAVYTIQGILLSSVAFHQLFVSGQLVSQKGMIKIAQDGKS